MERVDKTTLGEVGVRDLGESIFQVVAPAEAKRKKEVMSGTTENDHMAQMKDMAPAVVLSVNIWWGEEQTACLSRKCWRAPGLGRVGP